LNAYLQGQRMVEDQTRNNLTMDAVQPQAGFYDAFQASVGLFIDENLSISDFINTGVQRERNDDIRSMIRSGDIPMEIAGAYISQTSRGPHYDWDGLVGYVNDKRGGNLLTNQELDDNIRSTLKQRRDYSQRTLSRTTGTGLAGEFLGNFAGVAMDPVNVLSFLSVPYRAVRGLSVLNNALRAGGREAIVGMAAETAIQPFVIDWKAEIDAPYSAVEAIQTIGFTGGFGFVLGGGAGALAARYGTPREAIDAAKVRLEVAGVRTPPMQPVPMRAPMKRERVEFNIDDVKAELIIEARERLLPAAGGRISRGEVKSLREDILQLRQQRNAVDDPTPEEIKAAAKTIKGSARKAKKTATTRLGKEAQDARDLYTEQITTIEERISTGTEGATAVSALSRLDQGILPAQEATLLQALEQEFVPMNVATSRNSEYVRTQNYKISDHNRIMDEALAKSEANMDIIDASDATRGAYDDLVVMRDQTRDGAPDGDIQAAEHFERIHRQLLKQNDDGPRGDYDLLDDLGPMDDVKMDIDLAQMGDIEIPFATRVNNQGEIVQDMDTISNILARADAQEERLQALRGCIIG